MRSNSIVGIISEKSLEMMIGLYAILKAGGAYLPIDPIYPYERINYIIEDSNSKIILVQSKYVKKLQRIVEL